MHGKNHHLAGSFGEQLRAFELLRSDGTRLTCGPDTNADWFRATVGGLGLTGLIAWVEIQLQRIANPWIAVSYTHLDVYKRQNIRSNAFPKARREPFLKPCGARWTNASDCKRS